MATNETKRRLLLSKWRVDQESGRDGDAYAEGLEAALLAVRDWMHEPLFLGRPMRDPRKILRQVEEVL
jgi:hypothetical protein